LANKKKHYGISLIDVALMDNHFHFFIRIRTIKEFSTFLQGVNTSFAKLLNHAIGSGYLRLGPGRRARGLGEASPTLPPRTGHVRGTGSRHSMEPKILHRSYCLFRSPVTGSRQGRIVLVQHRDLADPVTGGSYTVKRYRSAKHEEADGSWHHIAITLEPLNPRYRPIVLTAESEDQVAVIAEFVSMLG